MNPFTEPKRPTSRGWIKASTLDEWGAVGYVEEAWLHLGTRIRVIASVVVSRVQYGVKRRLRYHISISRQSKRCSGAEVLWALAQFGMVGAVEDLRNPGARVRQFWAPLINSPGDNEMFLLPKSDGDGSAGIDRAH